MWNKKVYTEFNKKDSFRWANALFYSITEDEKGNKILTFYAETLKFSSKKWAFRYFYNDKLRSINGLYAGKLNDLLEWGDINYSLSEVLETWGTDEWYEDYWHTDTDPWDAYYTANKCVKGFVYKKAVCICL